MTQLTKASSNSESRRADSDGGVPDGIALPVATDLPATLSAKELRKRLRDRFKDIRALEVEYSYTQHSSTGDETLVPHSRAHVAFKGRRRFKADSNVGRETSFEYPHIIRSFDGNQCVRHRPGCKTAEVQVGSDRRMHEDTYLALLGVSSKSDSVWSSAADSMFFLGSVLESVALGWEVLPNLEKVDGYPCHVLESLFGHQRLWIDAEIGFAVRLHERYGVIAGLPANEWPFASRCTLCDYRLVSNTVWLPWQLKIVLYGRDPHLKNLSSQVSMTGLGIVVRLAVNEEVPDELFEPQLPPGTVVLDFASNRYYEVGDDGRETKLRDLKE